MDFAEYLLDLASSSILLSSKSGRYKIRLEEYAVYNDFFTVCREDVATSERLYYLFEVVRSPLRDCEPVAHLLMTYRNYQSVHIAYVALTDLE